MKAILALLLLVAIAHASVPFYRAELHRRVPNSYIIQFNHTEPVGAAAYMSKLAKMGYKIDRQYSFGTFHGVALTIENNENLVKLLNDEANILHVEEDSVVSIGDFQEVEQTCNTAQNQDWNLSRLSHRTMEDSDNLGTYFHPGHGASDVYSYIIDTGILLGHVEFTGRATFGANYAGGVNDDCNGHGTHVAGTVGGVTYGVARQVNLVAVKVLNCQGSGTITGVVSGVNYAATNCNGRKCTANMSLGGGFSPTLNNAVAAAVDTGVPFAVAAGNENQNACNVSPASEPKAITVGATAQQAVGGSEVNIDVRSSFSNYGSCVDIFGPGSSIRSAWIDTTGQGRLDRINTISGTSMASPHACGVASILVSENPGASPAQIVAMMTQQATAGVIQMNCVNTVCNQSPNLLTFADC